MTSDSREDVGTLMTVVHQRPVPTLGSVGGAVAGGTFSQSHTGEGFKIKACRPCVPAGLCLCAHSSGVAAALQCSEGVRDGVLYKILL